MPTSSASYCVPYSSVKPRSVPSRGLRVPIENGPSRQRSLSTGWGLGAGTPEFLLQNSTLHLAGMYMPGPFYQGGLGLPRVPSVHGQHGQERDTSCCYCHVSSLTSSHLLTSHPPASATTPPSVFSKNLGQAQGFCACHSPCLECSSIKYTSLPRLPLSGHPGWLFKLHQPLRVTTLPGPCLLFIA